MKKKKTVVRRRTKVPSNSNELIEKTLSEKQVFHGNFLNVWRDEIENPNGIKTTREYIRHPGAAVIIPILPNSDLILVEQFRYPLKTSFLEFPAGKRDPGEDFLTTAHRELEEEVGYRAGKMKFLTTIYPVIGYADERMDLFVATNLKSGKAHLDQDENLRVVTMSLKKLMQLVKAGKVPDVKTQIAAFWLSNF